MHLMPGYTLGKGKGAVVPPRPRHVPDALVHGRHLIVAHHIAAFHIVALFGSLVRYVAQKDDAVARLGVEDDVLLGVTPSREFGAVLGVEMGRLLQMAVFDVFEVAVARPVVLQVIGRIDSYGLGCQAVLLDLALFLPIAVEIHVPLLQVRPRIDVRPQAA